MLVPPPRRAAGTQPAPGPTAPPGAGRAAAGRGPPRGLFLRPDRAALARPEGSAPRSPACSPPTRAQGRPSRRSTHLAAARRPPLPAGPGPRCRPRRPTPDTAVGSRVAASAGAERTLPGPGTPQSQVCTQPGGHDSPSVARVQCHNSSGSRQSSVTIVQCRNSSGHASPVSR